MYIYIYKYKSELILKIQNKKYLYVKLYVLLECKHLSWSVRFNILFVCFSIVFDSTTVTFIVMIIMTLTSPMFNFR